MHIAYEFEEVVTEVLSRKLMMAREQCGAQMVVLAG